MGGRSVDRVLLDGRGPRRAVGRFARRLGFVLALVLLLGVAAPTGRLVPEDDPTPVSWLWDWVSARPSWAYRDPPTPEQSRGRSTPGHYVKTSRVPDAGRAVKAKGELAAYEPHELDGGSRTVGAATPGFVPATSKRVASAATERSDTYRNADGSYTRRVYPRPVNYRAADGTWRPIDSRLRRGGDGRLGVTANSVGLSFAGAAPTTAAGQDLVRIRVRPGVELSYTFSGATVGAPTADGEVARYPNVFSNVDLELGARADGVAETLVLRGADAPARYETSLRLTGLTPRIGAGGGVELVDAAGAVAVSMPVAHAEDSAGATSRPVVYELVTDGGAPALRMSIDEQWLRDPTRKFPLTLHQSAAVGDGAIDDNLAVGTRNSGGQKSQARIPLEAFETTYAGQPMTGAELNLFMSYQGDGKSCVARPYTVHTGEPIGTASPSSEKACDNTRGAAGVGVWSRTALDVAAVDEWVSGAADPELTVRASESDSAAWKRFATDEPNVSCDDAKYGGSGCDPFLAVTFAANVAPQIDSRHPGNNVALNTLTPEFAARGHDPDNSPGTGLRYHFLIYNDQGTQIHSSGWQPSVYRVPAGVLAWGKTYLYAVQINDFSSTGPPAPVLYAFTTQVPQPIVTSSLAQNGGKGYEASAGNYTMSDVDAQVAGVGPALSIERDYNSLDTRASSAFGQGWSSILDMRVSEGVDASGALTTATVRYPSGQDTTFGRNDNGVWVPPSGRFSVFKPLTGGGYTLTDKDATAYEFGRALGGGAFGITKITDANGRAMAFRYDASGRIDRLTSASGRTLTVTWTTPAGAQHPHVDTVTTDPATPGSPATALTWNYGYDKDRLAQVCAPGAGGDCARYEYTFASQHASTVLNSGPYSYWRLDEPAGATTARSSVLSNDGTDDATYSNVTLGGAAALPGSTATSASFNGTSSLVTLPTKTTTESSSQSVSMWFKTGATRGVLFSYQRDAVTPGATTPGNYDPVLYIGQDGKLRGEFWMGATTPITTANPVNDNQWHHVALSGNGGIQTMYLDGVKVGDLSGAIQLQAANLPRGYVGAGFVGHGWPSHGYTQATATFFNGSIADVAFYNSAVTAGTVTAMFKAGSASTPGMSKVTSEAGRVTAQVRYDTVSGRVDQVTDENGGTWQIGAPTVSGSSQVYVSSVLGSQPRDYLRLGDLEATADAVSQVMTESRWRYHNVTFNTTPPNTTSPFADTYGATFNGTSSYLRMDASFEKFPAEGPTSVELWFKTPVNHARSGVLFANQSAPVDGGAPATSPWTPVLYVGADGLLRGEFWTGSALPITSSAKVNDGKWHHVVLASSYTNNKQTLYLDNAIVGSLANHGQYTFAEIGYIGAGTTRSWPSSSGDVSYFNGNIAEYAYYNKELTAAEVDAHYKASRSSLPPPAGVTGPVLTPISTATVTDPDGKASKQMFDVVNGGRLIAETDALGNTTSYGFDVGGFVSVVYDPLGRKTESGKDVRGNTIRSTTCSFGDGEVGDDCETMYYKYWPDATTTNLTPDARNDQLTDIVDQRGLSEDDQQFRTKLTYDTAGNRTGMTSPPVPGFPAGRTTAMTYTTATTPADGGGVTPPGLPLTTRSAGGAVQSTAYNAAGDAVRVTDPAGLVTEFSHDGLGRVTAKKVISDAYPAGQVTTYRYDTDGQIVETTEPPVTDQVTGAVHTARTNDVLDPDGHILSRTVADTTGGDAARTSTTAYDAHGQAIKSVDPSGAVTLFEYDVYGNQVKATSCDSDPDPGDACPGGDVLRVLQHVYDANGQLLTSTLTGEDGTQTRIASYAYYADGALASETDAMDWTTRYEYFGDGDLKKVTRTDGVTTYVVEENLYDNAGNLISRTENNGATTTGYRFDAAGRLQSTSVDPDDADPHRTRRSTQYTYDADDRVVATRHMAGEQNTVLSTVENTYDPMGRVTSETVSSASANSPVGWWKLEETAAAGQQFFAYDSSPSHHDLLGSAGVSVGGGFGTFTTGTLDTSQVLDTTQSYTVSAWVRVNDFNTYQTAVGQGGQLRGAFSLQYNKPRNRWAFIAPSSDSASPSTFYLASSAAALTANTWVHLVGVFDAGTKGMALYVNGAAGTSGTNPTPFASAPQAGLSLGGVTNADQSGGNEFRGSLDNVQVYQRALSAAEVATLYGGGNGRTGNATVRVDELTTLYTVDDRGLTTATRTPNGNTTDYAYDEAGRLAVTTEPSVNAETYGATAVPVRPVSRAGYNTFGEQVESQDPLGNVVQTRVDALGRPIATILPDYTPPGGGAPIAGASTTSTYDKLGQLVSSTDPRGKTTTYEYDPQGNPVKVTGPTGKVTTAKFDKVGDLLETVDPTGAKTTATYDFLGRTVTSSQVVRQPTPVTNTVEYKYGTGVYGATAAAGPWLREVKSQDGVVVQATYNRLGERLTVDDGAGNITRTEYDGLGRVVGTRHPDNTRQNLSYDGAGRVLRAQSLDAAGVVLTTDSMAYDNNGNVIASTDPRNTTTTYTYDALDRVTGEVQPISATDSITTSFGYDAAGNATRFTDGRANDFWTTYNPWGLPESQIEPATVAYPGAADRTFTAAYDAAGRLTAQLMPGGVRVDNQYDDLNRLTGQTGGGAEAATAARTFGYDDAGRLTSLSAPGGSDTVAYDDRGLPLSITGPNDASSFTYTRDGRLATRTDAAGTTTYAYDSAGRLKSADNPTTNIRQYVSYNAMSQPNRILYGGAGGDARTLTYDPLHRLKTDTLETAGGATVGSITYGYDLNGNETSKVTTGFAGSASNSYTYDLADRLKSWTAGTTTTAYAYDKSGNRTQAGSKTFTYDARNQLLTQGGATPTAYAYTPRGTLRTTTSGSVGYTTAADAFGQVTSQQAAGGTQTYEYDALGRAVRPGFEYTGLGNTLAADGTAIYTRGPGGELIGVGTGTGADSPHAWTDQHTDLVGLLDDTSTSLMGSATYDPLGTVVASAGMVGNLGYQSEWTDGLTGRVNMMARWYNTDTGQFDTRDTAGVSPMPDSVRANRFQYGDANPLTTVDPTGHWGLSSLGRAVSSVTKYVPNPVTSFRAYTSYAYSAFNYVSSGRAWQDVKSSYKYVKSKASKAWDVVRDSTVRWAKKKYNSVKDAYHSAKKCLKGGARKCVKETAKAAVKRSVSSIRSTVDAIKKDPWKFVATAAAGLAAAVAVGALCATGVGCLIVAGAVAGAMASGAGYMVDVGRGDEKFSWSGLAGTMIEGGLDGALSAGISRFTGGVTRFTPGGLKSRLPSPTARAKPSGGGRSPAAGGGSAPRGRPAGGSPAAGSRSGGGSGPAAAGPRRGGGDGPGGGSCNRRHSFDPDTLVLMADGSAKPIGDVGLGEKVAATDPETGVTGPREVTRLHVNLDSDLTNVTVRDGDTGKTTTLKTTQHHPFWDATDGRWVDAGELKAGHRLLVHDDKRLEGDGTGAGSGGGGPPAEVTVAEVLNFAGAELMHDLTVAYLHTYYVIAGKTPILVHNVGGCEDDDGNSFENPRLWKAGDGDADSDKQAFIPMSAWVRDASNFRPGRHTFVVMPDRSLRAFHSDSMFELFPDWNKPGPGHTSLSRRKPVIMAGNFDVDDNGRIVSFDNGSGHYLPKHYDSNMALRDIAMDALRRGGFSVDERAWNPWR